MTSTKKDPVLVVLQLSGGNDILNTLVPYTNPLYYDNRPNVRIPEDQVLPINDTLGFNPNMAPLKALYDEGKVAVHGRLESGVLGVGDAVLLQPGRKIAHIDSMSIDDEATESTAAGESALLKLRGVEDEDVWQGYVLTDPAEPLPNTSGVSQ